ncbi:MAG: hydrogenase nickel incorporation protein HypA [Gammaproteobacteria bacterium]|nr:hydrogenase nickel incorporation protein HypA [Gammaproteobacteria bacterium]
MHELAICQALMEQVESIALEEQADHVTAIHLGIGPLSGVEPRLLEQAFSIARAGSIAADAELMIASMPIQVSCKQCGQLTEALPNRLVCGSCGDWRTHLISGDELELISIELVKEQIKDKRPKIQAIS